MRRYLNAKTLRRFKLDTYTFHLYITTIQRTTNLYTCTSKFTIFAKLNFKSQDVSLQESIALAEARALFVTLSAIVNGFAGIEEDTTRGDVSEL